MDDSEEVPKVPKIEAQSAVNTLISYMLQQSGETEYYVKCLHEMQRDIEMSNMKCLKQTNILNYLKKV